jgi:SAM-dependent MidA family methyltransferase
MSDILRTVGQFRTFAKAISAVWLVEAGEGLRMKQKKVLCGESIEMKEVSDGTGKTIYWEAVSKQGIPVRWVEDIALLPSGTNEAGVPFIIAHEFFDALPIHAYESVAPLPERQGEAKTQQLDGSTPRLPKSAAPSKVPQWRELLVAPAPAKLNLLAPSKSSMSKEPDADFQLTLAKASNPSSLVIPERPRYRQLKMQASSRIEVSPESSRYVREFAKRIGGSKQSQTQRQSAGAALIIDYGPADNVPVNSLRGIRKHKIISPFLYAGDADISADVDFGALADAALEASPDVEVHGPVEQGMWLKQLGIEERAERLLKGMAKSTESEELERKRKELETGWRRLVEGGPKGMGKAYKVMSILPENGGRRRPVGFGGGVVE